MPFIVPAAIAALLLVGGPNLDTVFLRDGGRLRGTVVEEIPGTGVSIQLPDGELRKVPAADVLRVEYGDGTQGSIGAPPAAPVEGGATPSAAEPLPPAQPGTTWQPVAPAQPLPPEAGPPPDALAHPRFITLAGALGFAIPSGKAEPGVEMTDVTTTQFLIGLEGAIRFVPEFQLGLLLDIGVGGAGSQLEAECDASGISCNTTEIDFGIFARYAFTPRERTTPWVALGVATGILSIDPDSSNYCGTAYGGNQYLRLSAGYDFRGKGQLGLGLFAGAVFGKYTDFGRYRNLSGGCNDFQYESLPDTANHAYVQGGVRLILFP